MGYSKDDFVTLKNTLQQFIPFINFFNLTSKEYLDKVYPYKKVIPKDLRENLIIHFIDQPKNNPEPKIISKETSSKSIDSKIITIKHAKLISKWIDRLEITNKMKNSYEFKLILRGSRDGFSSQKFHEICDYQSHTIAIIKVKNSNEILGGYNPIVWKSNDTFGATKDSFIFSFNKNKENIENYILSRVKNETYAIVNNLGLGPSFGDGDLKLRGNNYSCSVCRYTGFYDKFIRKASGANVNILLEITDKMKNSYEFKLILRGSRDGFSPSKFHEICDNKSHTITIINVGGSNEILGGYNPIIWKSDRSFGITKDSFIFSFKDKENIENYILSRVNNENYAIENDSRFGPAFGIDDLELCGENFNQNWCYFSGIYDKQIREGEGYSVEEYEIFQIIKD
ncbi:hypothetical protein RhiirA4_450550 [Rhizophagus irregularis]|uniref:TLDc domain-containing protein n=1 Tax=Rhizophagus irregularis TaxID=588596 RepID=A0A2I1FTE8_9GLOM|nr:hypothetical protein RhiirA4_450550 [Rhizophagus irregularis]